MTTAPPTYRPPHHLGRRFAALPFPTHPIRPTPQPVRPRPLAPLLLLTFLEPVETTDGFRHPFPLHPLEHPR